MSAKLMKTVNQLKSNTTGDANNVCQTCLSNVIPINDITGNKYSDDERQLRCKVAAVYRLIHSYGWDEVIYNHTTVRVSGDDDHFLLNPFGLLYNEVTASSLLKVDLKGNVIDQGSTKFNFNTPGFVIHSAIHSTRADIRAIIHIHYPACVAVSAMKCGLLATSQWSALLGNVSYHDYQGFHIDTEERKQISDSLGPTNKALFLRNHGVVACGETIEEALYITRHLVTACETQIQLMSCGLENIQIIPRKVLTKVDAYIAGKGLSGQGRPGSDDKDNKKVIWNLEFDAQMRMLDNRGLSTGYQYN